jgi:penicillin-binding protein 1A
MKVSFRIVLVVLLGILAAAGVLVGWFYSGIGLPKLSSLNEYKAAQNSKVFASDGTLLCELRGDQDREVIALEKMPDALKKGVIAIEDSDFYQHSGINWKAVIRALWANVVKGEVVQGGSTITQQYVKNAYVGPKRTLWRKIQEARLAYELEQKYSKNKILELYLNDIYFGQGCYGIFTAASKYYGKDPQQLTLAECAMLAGLIRSPSYYDPYLRPQEVLERRRLVLNRMVKKQYISEEERDFADKEPMNLVGPNQVRAARRAPYFCDYITELVKREYGDQQAFRGGLRIYTTIDLRLQDLAENAVKRQTDPDDGPDAALVCVDPRTGYIKAMVGGKNYAASQFNVAADGHRQAGSSFKVFVLARALADRVSPNESYDASSPRIIELPDGGKWKVTNYDGRGSGSTTIRNATVHSINVVFAQLIMDVGPARVAEMAKSMGVQSPVEPNPAIALGGLGVGVTPLDMASAFGTLANGGVHALTRSISKVTDASGNVLDEGKPETTPVLDPKVASEANDILAGVVSSGTGRGASIGRPQAGKTGTTEDHADAWFVGYTPDLVTAVWVGYPQGRISMGGMTGGSLPATIWRTFMGKALEDIPPTAFSKGDELSPLQTVDTAPSETVTVTLCDVSGLLATPQCPSVHSATFRNGEQPTATCNVHTGTDRTVPDVVGRTSAGAISEISSAGFKATVVNQPSEQPAGTVVAQAPAAGTSLGKGGVVTIFVSSGPSRVPVPGVVGMQESSARATIAASALSASITYTTGSPVGVVVSQSPSAGARVNVGSVVSITVNRSSNGGGLFATSALFLR